VRPLITAARLRVALGLVAGVVLLCATFTRVDLAATLRAVTAASLPLVVVGLGIVSLDLVLRAVRWRVLLQGARGGAPAALGRSLGYVGIGYLANLLLPARTGDLLRAYLAGRAFGLSRLAALGTIVVERAADAGAIVVLALLSGAVVVGVVAVHELAAYAALIAAAGVFAALVTWRVLTGSRVASTRLGGLGRSMLERLATGTRALRTPSGAIGVALSTVAATALAVSVGWVSVAAVGIVLSPVQAVLFVSGITLALAIPGAPGGLGTYEFVGVAILTAFALDPNQALAAVILLRVLTTLPVVVLGVASAWVLHLRPAVMREVAGARPAIGAAKATLGARAETA
jgi:glycosyltransferase 2 family protein